MTLKEELIEIDKILKGRYSGITTCKREGTKYFKIRKQILDETKFLPESTSISDRIYYILNNIINIKICGCGCNNPLINPEKTYLPGHGNKMDDVKKQKINTYQNKYGVDNPSQLELVKAQKEQTLINNYGSLEEAIKSKIQSQQQTNLKRYGNIYAVKSDIIRQKIRDSWHKFNRVSSNKQKGVTHKNNFYETIESDRLEDKFSLLFTKSEYEGFQKIYKFKCKKCNTITESNLSYGNPLCRTCNPYIDSGGQSQQEFQLQKFLMSLGLSDLKVHNRSVLKNLELDFYIPSLNIAIEYHGNYWHSQLSGNKAPMYHLEKLNRCNEVGIRLIQIFEDEWLNKIQIVKSRLKHLFHKTKYSIGARECELRFIDNHITRRYNEKYHLQGHANASVSIGAYYKNRLVAWMTFCKTRFSKQYEWELLRFCTISNFNVMGISSRLLKQFITNYKPSSIVTYADRRWSNGGLYEKLGMKLENKSIPNYYYLEPRFYSNRLSRIIFQKHRLKDKLDIFDPNLTEWDNMKNNGYDRIWDCGNLVYSWCSTTLTC